MHVEREDMLHKIRAVQHGHHQEAVLLSGPLRVAGSRHHRIVWEPGRGLGCGRELEDSSCSSLWRQQQAGQSWAA